MDMPIVEAFYSVAQLSRMQLFTDSKLTPIVRVEDSKTAAMGWVGPDYRPGGIVMLGINPGGGTDAYRGNATDDLLYNELRAFRDSPLAQRATAFDAANRTWMAIQRTHGIWPLIAATLDAAGIPIEKAAFLNMLPFRTRENKPAPQHVMARAWSLATSRQLLALAPGALVCLGYRAAKTLGQVAGHALLPRIYPLKRSNGDTWITDEARATLSQLREDMVELA